MSDVNSRLFAQAQKVTAVYRTIPTLKTVLLTGSVAHGYADLHSDVDLVLLYEEWPSRAELKSAYERLQGTRRWVKGRHQNKKLNRIREAYFVGDVRYDPKHSTVRPWERQMLKVVGYRDSAPLDLQAQADTADILAGIPLYGPQLIQQWRVKAAKYPDELARAMVKSHLHFPPRWEIRTRMVERDDFLVLYDLFTLAEKNILAVLLGLNRVYHPVTFRRIDRLVTKLPIAPNDLSVRLESILRDDPHYAVEQLEGLIEETFALVASHMPDLDVRAEWDIYRRPRLPRHRDRQGVARVEQPKARRSREVLLQAVESFRGVLRAPLR